MTPADVRRCANATCNDLIERRDGEKHGRFLSRRFCSRTCASTVNLAHLEPPAGVVELAEWRRPDWHDSAPCRSTDPDAWFPLVGDNDAVLIAQRICGGCPYKAPCLSEGVQLGERYGIRGGISMRSVNRSRLAVAS
ncbi:transcription factor WhiB [Pseudonocardia sediminis]|uniref:Transcription factor WhiB n=1 Tax=Pseudonocardia sediminis TaxID=1397368 RepID=A0A4Q7V2F7_PSEST|nr:transcription factor WhiB [Pseudonocardia sediminis]